MATSFTLNKDTFSYDSADSLYFGINTSVHSDYVMPVAKFEFFDSIGNSIDAPNIYIRMPGTFNSTLINSYTEERGIMGNPVGDAFSTETLKSLGGGLIDSVQSQILKGLGAAAGFIGSAGQAQGRRQIEFTTRKFINEFQQLVYAGPSFRRFQLPFAMKPLSYDEAAAMRKIIKTFRVASSPRVNTNDIGTLSLTPIGGNDVDTGGGETLDQAAERIPTEGDVSNGDAAAATETTESTAGTVSSEGNAVTLTYPDFCKLSILLYKGSTLTTLFKSELCAIETVAVDYGSQNKMTFFPDNGGEYFPTDVNLSVSLREVVLLTAGYVGNETGTIL
jgi:hypothetical protein